MWLRDKIDKAESPLVGLYCSFISLFLGLIYGTARIGFDPHPFLAVLPVVFFSFFILLFPPFLRLITIPQPTDKTSTWLVSETVFHIVNLIGLTLMGLMASAQLAKIFSEIITFLGVLVFAAFLTVALFRRKINVFVLILIGLLAVWLGGVLWGGIYLDPLFTERLMVGRPWIGSDTLFHSALSQIIQTYHVASTGLDGLPFGRYHWGSHWWMAQLARLLGMKSIDFYQLGFPVVFIPLLIHSLFNFAACLKLKSENGPAVNMVFGIKEWGFLCLVFIGILPENFLVSIDSLNFMLVSESYVMAVSLSLIIANLLVPIYREKEIKSSTGGWIVIGAILLPFLFFIGRIKPSFPYFWVVVVIFVLLRSKILGKKTFWALFIVTGWLVALIPIFQGDFSIRFCFLPIIKQPISEIIKPFFFLVHYFWALVFISLRLFHQRIKTLADFRVALTERKIIDVEILAVVCFGNSLPGVFTFLPLGSEVYFSGIQQYLAAALILAWLPVWTENIRWEKINSFSSMAVLKAGREKLSQLSSRSELLTPENSSAGIIN